MTKLIVTKAMYCYYRIYQLAMHEPIEACLVRLNVVWLVTLYM